MKKRSILFLTALLLGGTICLQARDHGEGVRLAADIVHLVKTVVTPPPAVVVPPPAPVVVAPAPQVVVTPAPVAVPAYSYGYYNNVYVPTYNGWYYYGNSWCWGGRGPRPYHPPRWVPPPQHHHRHYRPLPPPPPRHYKHPGHRPPPPPPRHNRHGRHHR